MNAPADIAKIFTTGRSQAVRLPKAYRFDTAEVFIERKGDQVVLRPKYSKDEWWARVQNALSQFEGFPEEIQRERGPLPDDIESPD